MSLKEEENKLNKLVERFRQLQEQMRLLQQQLVQTQAEVNKQVGRIELTKELKEKGLNKTETLKENGTSS